MTHQLASLQLPSEFTFDHLKLAAEGLIYVAGHDIHLTTVGKLFANTIQAERDKNPALDLEDPEA